MADPRTIGRYQVLRPLGQGGMGAVYLAEDPLLKRRVAIKVVRVTGAARHQATLRFRREAEISAQLNHPNLVTVFDVGVEEDLGPFLAMEYVEGKSLGRHIRDRDLDLETSARVLIQAGRALRAAHRRAIVHRDVKPDNILLSEEGRAKLMDFGIARTLGNRGPGSDQSLDLALAEGGEAALAQTLALRLTSSGDFLGSPAYAPPEVLKGSEGTPASDRYSFAATAFELLTGKLPHPGGGLTEIIIHILQKPVAIPPDMSPRLAAVFQRALAVDPDDRYTTLPEFLEELIDALPGPASMRARLFTFLSQDEDGTGSISPARFRQLEPASTPAPEPTAQEARVRGTAPVKITLAEDPVESYLSTRRTSRHTSRSGGGGTNWGQILKWFLVAFVILQLFWWLAPALSRLQF